MIFSFHTSSKQQARVDSAQAGQACPSQRYLLPGQQHVLVSIGPEETGITVTFHQLVDMLLGEEGGRETQERTVNQH